MRRLFVGCFATFGVIVFLLLAGLVAAGYYAASSVPDMEEMMRAEDEPGLERDAAVLTLDLRFGVPESLRQDPFAGFGFGGRRLDFYQLLQALERAGADAEVRGLLMRVDGAGLPLAQAQELHDALARFQAQDKFVHAYADSIGEFGPGTTGYYLASAADKLVLQPQGGLGLIGLRLEVPFLRGLLEQIGITPQAGARGQYKNAVNTFTEREFTEAHRESLQSLTDSLFEQIVTRLTEARGLDASAVRARIDNGPYMAEAALEAGLIDALAYADEAEREALRLAESDGNAGLGIAAYARRNGLEDDRDGPAVALVHALGAIQRGPGDDGFGGSNVIAADDLSATLREARRDDAIEAVVLRIDSPGGSAVGAETIAREVRLLEDSGKPVIVSMGATAASGGYWIAMHARRIVAQPATLTGSIGVFAGKPVVEDLLDRYGVNVGTIQRGENADMFALTEPFDARGEAKLERFLDQIYAAFVQGVAEGRGLDPARVDEIAQGRVWTGAQAAEIGLVDRLGGMDTAFALVREELGLEADAPLAVTRLPRQRDPFSAVLATLRRGLITVGEWQELRALITGERTVRLPLMRLSTAD